MFHSCWLHSEAFSLLWKGDFNLFCKLLWLLCLYFCKTRAKLWLALHCTLKWRDWGCWSPSVVHWMFLPWLGCRRWRIRQEVFPCSLPPHFLLMLCICLQNHWPSEDEIINVMAVWHFFHLGMVRSIILPLKYRAQQKSPKASHQYRKTLDNIIAWFLTLILGICLPTIPGTKWCQPRARFILTVKYSSF